MRPRITPSTIAGKRAGDEADRTRARLIATWRKISPLCTIGMAVWNTTSGGGIRNGLKTKVDRNCQIANAIDDRGGCKRIGRLAARDMVQLL